MAEAAADRDNWPKAQGREPDVSVDFVWEHLGSLLWLFHEQDPTIGEESEQDAKEPEHWK